MGDGKSNRIALALAAAYGLAASIFAVRERRARKQLERTPLPEPVTVAATEPTQSWLDPNRLEATVETSGHTMVVGILIAMILAAATLVVVLTAPPAFVAAGLAFGPILFFAFLVLIAHWRIHHPPTAE